MVFWGAVAVLMYAGSMLGPALVLFAVLQAVSVAQDQLVWHGLIDPKAPASIMSNTIQWIGDSTTSVADDVPRASHGRELDPARSDIDWAFFDNFHLIHHLFPSRHFTEYRNLFDRKSAEICEARAAVFPLSYMPRFLGDMWRGDLDRMAAEMISGMTKQQCRELLHCRVAPVPAVGRAFPLLSTRSPAAVWIDGAAARLVVALV